MLRTALVWGTSGQLGSYVSELLLENAWKVVGVKRRNSTYGGLERLHNCVGYHHFSLVEGDITDSTSVHRIFQKVKPDFIFNCSAQSHVATSFEQPEYTFKTIVDGTLNILNNMTQDMRMVTCSSSEMFGDSVDSDGFQRETTPFRPNSPYAAAKLAAHNLVSIYRRSYRLHASCAIPFNFESPRRGSEFVTQKIVRTIASGLKLHLGNITAMRDWQHCYDVARALYLMSLADKPDDYVIASGRTRSVEEFLYRALDLADLDPTEGVHWDIDPKLFRPCEVPYLCGDSRKIRETLHWEPMYTFDRLVEEMWEAAKECQMPNIM